MRHNKVGRKFGRPRRQRKALLRSLVHGLVKHEKITTTEAKAKELKSVIDSVIKKAKKSLKGAAEKATAIRQLRADYPKETATKLIGDLSERWPKRSSGYVRVVKLSPRKSDGARMAVVEFV